jgi:hypothetical protein
LGQNIVLGILTIYLHTRFNTSSSNSSLDITLKVYAKNFLKGHHVCFTNNYLNKSFIFMKIYYYISLQDPTENGSSIAPTSHVCTYTMMLLIVENKKSKELGGL